MKPDTRYLYKAAGLFDTPRPTLDPSVWAADESLLPEHRDFIIKTLTDAFAAAGYEGYDKWVHGIYFTGSLAGYQYNQTSDVDIDVLVHAGELSEMEYQGGIEPEQARTALEALKEALKKVVSNLPGTEHPLEYYFVYEDVPGKTVLPVNVGMYDVLSDEWATPPKRVDMTSTAEKVYPELMKFVHELAAKYDLNIGEMEKDIVDIKYLSAAISQFPPKYHAVILKEVGDKLEEINADIDTYKGDTKDLMTERFSGPYPVMPAELQMAHLKRYGYIALLKVLKSLTEGHKEVGLPDLPELDQALHEVPKKAGKDLRP